mmetsp:Transcript_28982/g.40990  ORF Transcript_28982/g.40990 Transcript_28982/m.40990 type:complete len:316 (-) Transcript_28982:176-1123(-)
MPNDVCFNRSPFALLVSLGSECDGQMTCSCCTCCGGVECNNFAGGTPAPSVAPTGSDNSPVQVVAIPNGFCFSGESTVETVNEGKIALKDLKVGDLIKNGDMVEPVYTFGHFDKEGVTEFIQIYAAGLSKPLEISPDHLLFTQHDIIPASSVVVGDLVMTADGRLTEVEKIGSVLAKGIFAPFTKSGRIVVNGFVASNYITFQENSASLMIAGVPVINMHWVSHVFMAPYRIWRNFFHHEETYVKGVNSWMVEPLRVLWHLLLEQNALVQIFVFLPLLMVVSITYAIETSWTLCFLGVATAMLFFGQTRKSKSVV